MRAAIHDPDGELFPSTAFVFGNEIGERVNAIKSSWLSACRRAHVHDLRFHDLRREAGSRWVMRGRRCVSLGVASADERARLRLTS